MFPMHRLGVCLAGRWGQTRMVTCGAAISGIRAGRSGRDARQLYEVNALDWVAVTADGGMRGCGELPPACPYRSPRKQCMYEYLLYRQFAANRVPVDRSTKLPRNHSIAILAGSRNGTPVRAGTFRGWGWRGVMTARNGWNTHRIFARSALEQFPAFHDASIASQKYRWGGRQWERDPTQDRPVPFRKEVCWCKWYRWAVSYDNYTVRNGSATSS